MITKQFKIQFHGTTLCSGENSEDAISNFLSHAETGTVVEIIIDGVKEIKKVYSVKIEAGTAVEVIPPE